MRVIYGLDLRLRTNMHVYRRHSHTYTFAHIYTHIDIKWNIDVMEHRCNVYLAAEHTRLWFKDKQVANIGVPLYTVMNALP